MSVVRPHKRFFGRAALVEQLDGTVSKSGSEDRTIRLGREGCDRTVGLGRNVLKLFHIKPGMSASRTGDPKTRKRGGGGREGWETDRLRQLSVCVPHANVVHVSCDVEVARVLVPGRDRPTRRRAGGRRRDCSESGSNLHLPCVVVLSEKANISLGWQGEKESRKSDQHSASDGRYRCLAPDAVRRRASETSLMKYMDVMGPDPDPFENRLKRFFERQSQTLIENEQRTKAVRSGSGSKYQEGGRDKGLRTKPSHARPRRRDGPRMSGTPSSSATSH